MINKFRNIFIYFRWCLSIYYTSPSAYKQLSDKGLDFLRLPSVSTLRDYTHFTDPKAGFNPDVIERLIKDAKVIMILHILFTFT